MKKEITIPILLTKEEKIIHVQVQAEIIGEFFAVHKTKIPGTECKFKGVESSDVFNIGYTVTHINTGHSVGDGFTEKAAIEYANLLSIMLPADLQKTTNPNHSALISLVKKYYSQYTKTNKFWYAIPEEVSIKSLMTQLIEIYQESTDHNSDLYKTIMTLGNMLVSSPYQSINDVLAKTCCA